MTERLDRIEAILERTAQRAEANTAAIQASRVASDELRLRVDSLVQVTDTNQYETAELRSTADSLLQVAEIHQFNHQAEQRNFEAIVTELREIRIEIRGLRTETQRIIEHLFARQENGE